MCDSSDDLRIGLLPFDHLKIFSRPTRMQLCRWKWKYWFQGEQDASVEAYANAYSANLQIFYTEKTQEMGLPIPVKKFMRIHINGSETYESIVREQQALAAAAISGATLIDTDSYGTRVGDGIHLSVTGQIDLGVYLASIT